MATTVPLDHSSSDTSFFGHPRGLATLFFTEMWERFSYYGMRALLILFMVAPVANGGMGFGVPKAGAIYGLYTAMAYFSCLPGGWVADRLIGQRRAVLYGGILIILGELCLATPGDFVFYSGLVLLMAGTGLLKPNVSTIVGQLYTQGDPRRDSGFSIYYMGINIGALLSPLVCGWVAEKISWRLGFAVAGLGMLIGVVQYLLDGKRLGTAGLYPSKPEDPAEDRRQKQTALRSALGAVGVFALVGILGATGIIDVNPERISNALGVVLVIIAIVIFAWLLLGKGWTTEERKRSGAILVLFLGSAVFWSAFEQAGSSLNLFAERAVDRHIGSFVYPASWFQFVQPLLVIMLAPVFAWLWLAMGSKQPSSPTKFTLGLVAAGLGFALLVPVASQVGLSPWWLCGTYFIHTLGELCLSPVGLSSMTKLAPARLGGFVMGMWFFATAVGNYMAGKMASLYESMALPTLFGSVAVFALGAAVVMALLIRPTVKLMSGVK